MSGGGARVGGCGISRTNNFEDEVLKRQVKTLYVCKRTHCPTPTVLIFTHCGVIIIIFLVN